MKVFDYLDTVELAIAMVEVYKYWEALEDNICRTHVKVMAYFDSKLGTHEGQTKADFWDEWLELYEADEDTDECFWEDFDIPTEKMIQLNEQEMGCHRRGPHQ